jgi:hypothetical protein
MRVALCLAALAGAGLLVACGGGGGGSSSTTATQTAKPVTKAERAKFVKSANKLCSDFNNGIVAAVAEAPGDTSHFYEGFMQRLGSLAPGYKGLNAFFADGFAVADAYVNVEEALKTQEPAAVAKTKAVVGKAKLKFARTARALGITACSGGVGFAPRPISKEFPPGGLGSR